MKTEKEIKFNPEFEEKLSRLGVREQFIFNFIFQRNSDSTLLKIGVEVLNLRPDWTTFILCAFNWEDTSEGDQFWNEIASHIFSDTKS